MDALPDYAVAYISELTSELESVITTCDEFMGMLDTVLEERDMAREERGTLEEDLGEAHRRLAYYENSNSPPSANSLEWRKKKIEARKKKSAEARKKDGGEKTPQPARARPGGRKGHRARRAGTTRSVPNTTRSATASWMAAARARRTLRCASAAAS